MLTLSKKGTPVAARHSDITNVTEIIYYTDEIDGIVINQPIGHEILYHVDKEWFQKNGKYYAQKIIDAVYLMLQGKPPQPFYEKDHTTLSNLYPVILDNIKARIPYMITVKDRESKVYPIIMPEERQRHYYIVNGPAGAGKTVFAAELMTMYNELYPNNRIFLITNKETSAKEATSELPFVKAIPRSEWFDTFATSDAKKRSSTSRTPKAKRFKIYGADEAEEEIDEEEDDDVDDMISNVSKAYKFRPTSDFKDSLIVMDDMQNVTPPVLNSFMVKLRRSFAELGRSDNINLINCAHLIDVRRDARELDESTHITMFPVKCIPRIFQKYLCNILSLDSKTAKIIKDMVGNERVVTFVKGYPLKLITQERVILLNETMLV